MNRQDTDWEKIRIHVPDKGLVFRIYKRTPTTQYDKQHSLKWKKSTE